jgi:hypothetical protein
VRDTAAGTIVSLVLLASVGNAPAWSAEIILGADAGDKVSVLINTKSANPANHQIKIGLKDAGIDFTAGGGSTDDPIANGAAAVVFSATDCQCILMDNPPGASPGWTQAPASGTGTMYKWKDAASKSSAEVKENQIKLKRKGGITFGLDAVPQGEVEVQVAFGSSPDTFCARFAAPAAKNDTATKYLSKVFAAGTAACSPVPELCGPCAGFGITTTTTTTTSTTTTTLPPCGVSTKCIFVTSTGSSGNLGGLAGADATCNARAGVAGLPGTYVAWLSTSTVHARDRVTSNGPYVTPTGDLVADSFADLTDGTLASPIDEDETGALVFEQEVWTGTASTGVRSAGAPAAAEANHCLDWTSSDGADLAVVGLTSTTNAIWSRAYNQFCDRLSVHLYCIQQ